MATRRERVVLELDVPAFAGPITNMRRAADKFHRLMSCPPSDRATPGIPGPQLWEGDQA